MDIRVFNVCLMVGWLMVLAGGIVINPGWGIALGGVLLLLLTLIGAYMGGIAPAPKKRAQGEGESA